MSEKSNLVLIQKDTVGSQIKRAQAEAQALALVHLGHLVSALDTVRTLAAEVEASPESFPAGSKALANRLTTEADRYILGLKAIIQRD